MYLVSSQTFAPTTVLRNFKILTIARNNEKTARARQDTTVHTLKSVQSDLLYWIKNELKAFQIFLPGMWTKHVCEPFEFNYLPCHPSSSGFVTRAFISNKSRYEIEGVPLALCKCTGYAKINKWILKRFRGNCCKLLEWWRGFYFAWEQCLSTGVRVCPQFDL